MGLKEIYTITRYEISQITSEFFFLLNFTILRNKTADKVWHLYISKWQSSKTIKIFLLYKTIIIARLLFHQEKLVEILDIKKAQFVHLS